MGFFRAYRLTITLTNAVYNQLSSLASQCEDSMSGIINRLIRLGMQFEKEDCYSQIGNTPIEQHCYPLIIQMNALIKNISAEILKLNQSDFDQLRQNALTKYNEIINETIS